MLERQIEVQFDGPQGQGQEALLESRPKEEGSLTWPQGGQEDMRTS